MPGLYSNLKGLNIPLGQVSTQQLYQQASTWFAQQLQPPQTAVTPKAASLADSHSMATPHHNPCNKKPKLEAIEATHVFFDVETNGLSKVCLAVQLCFLVTELKRDQQGQAQLTIKDYFDGCFAVDTLSPAAAKIHGITPEHLQKLQQTGELQNWSSIAPRFLLHCEAADAMIGHNITFDIRSIRDTFAFENLTQASAQFAALAANKKNCTLQMSKSWTKTLANTSDTMTTPLPTSHKLTQLFHHIFNQDMTNAHDAAADTLATAALFYHLKSASVTAPAAKPTTTPTTRTPKVKLSEPAEIHNTSQNSISWLVMENNHDRRHIIPKSLLRLFVNHSIEKFGAEHVARTCLEHTDFAVMANTSLNSNALQRLNEIAQPQKHLLNPDTSENELQDILYLLLKHNRFNYFLGESSWNRAIGAPMRWLRAHESNMLKKLAHSENSDQVRDLVEEVLTNLNHCLEGTHTHSDFNASFNDTRGSTIQQESAAVIEDIQTSLNQIKTATLALLDDQPNTSFNIQKKSIEQMLKNLQDSFAFDLSQSSVDSLRQTQNTQLSQIYTQLHQSLLSQDSHEFDQALHHFLDLNALCLLKTNLNASELYNPENPIFAARQLNRLISKNPPQT